MARVMTHLSVDRVRHRDARRCQIARHYCAGRRALSRRTCPYSVGQESINPPRDAHPRHRRIVTSHRRMTRCQFITWPRRSVCSGNRCQLSPVTSMATVQESPRPDAHGLPREAGGCRGRVLGAHVGFPQLGPPS
jgi:hypothetical protein